MLPFLSTGISDNASLRSFFVNLIQSFLDRSTTDGLPISGTVFESLDATSLASLLDGLRYRPCPYCPSGAIRSACDGREQFVFSYHFNNLNIGQRLTVNVNFTEPTDMNGCESVSFFVAPGNCVPIVPAVECRRRRLLGADALLDTLMYLGRTDVEKCQLLSRIFRSVIERGSASLPLRRLALVEIRTADADARLTVTSYAASPDCTEFTFVRSIPLADLIGYVSASLKSCRTPRLNLYGSLTMLVASGFLNWKDPFVVDELSLEQHTEGSVGDVLSIITHACDRWKTTKLRCLATQHCERVMEPMVAQRLTCLKLELPNFDCREALDQLLFHSPSLDLRLSFPRTAIDGALRRMWTDYMKSTVEPRLLAGDTQTFVRSLWIRVPYFLMDLCHVYANYSGMAETGDKLFYVYNVGSSERPLSIFYAWYDHQPQLITERWPLINSTSMKYYFIMPGWQKCDRSVPFQSTNPPCRHDFAEWFIDAPSWDPEERGWRPQRWYNHPEYLERQFYDHPQ